MQEPVSVTFLFGDLVREGSLYPELTNFLMRIASGYRNPDRNAMCSPRDVTNHHRIGEPERAARARGILNRGGSAAEQAGEDDPQHRRCARHPVTLLLFSRRRLLPSSCSAGLLLSCEPPRPWS